MRRVMRVRPERRRCATTLIAALLLLLCVPGLGRATVTEGAGGGAGAGIFLTEPTDRAMARLTEPGLAGAEQMLRFRALFNEAFDLPAIGHFVLGRFWRGRGQDRADV